MNCWNKCEHLKAKLTHLSTMCILRNAESKEVYQITVQKMQKRFPLDIIGTIAYKLFGILGDDFTKKYETEIQRSIGNQHALLEMIKNQTSFIHALGKNS